MTPASHLRRWGLAYLAILIAAVLFQMNFVFGINSSASLSHRLFLIHKGKQPARGQYVAFRWNGTTFVKILAGVPGDSVMRRERDFFVNGEFVGSAKTYGRSGTSLEAAPPGVIPLGRYFVAAPHPDSLDSRYAPPGLIAQSQIIGRAYALF